MTLSEFLVKRCGNCSTSSPVPFPDEDEPRARAPQRAPDEGREVGSFPAFEAFEDSSATAADDPYADVEVPGEAA